jgi:hypothetical protein
MPWGTEISHIALTACWPVFSTTICSRGATILRTVIFVLTSTAITGSIPTRVYARTTAVTHTTTSIACRTIRHKAIVGTGTAAVACILNGAIAARIATVAVLFLEAIIAAGPSAITLILIGAFRARIATVAAICCKAIIAAGTSTIAIILMGAFAARIATDRHVLKMIRLTVTTAIAGVLPRTLGRRITTAYTSSVIAITVVGAFIAGFTAIGVTISPIARVCAGNTNATIAGLTAITKKTIVTIPIADTVHAGTRIA